MERLPLRPFDLEGVEDNQVIVTPMVEYYDGRHITGLTFEIGTAAQVRAWLAR